MMLSAVSLRLANVFAEVNAMYQQHSEPPLSQLRKNAFAALAMMAVVLAASVIVVMVWS
jgi:hypothetical protein